MRRPSLSYLLLVAAALLPLGCRDADDTVGPVCTLIGCTSGLTLEFDGGPATVPYRLEVTSNRAADVVYTADCAAADLARCGPGRFFPDFLADRVFVTVVTAGGRASYERIAQYRVTYPNGRRCGPECRFGTVRVPRPER